MMRVNLEFFKKLIYKCLKIAFIAMDYYGAYKLLDIFIRSMNEKMILLKNIKDVIPLKK
jgi:hypothetical protein